MSDIDISVAHNEYRLNGTLQHLMLGPDPAKLYILDGTRPAPGGAKTTTLAVFTLDDPPGVVAGGVLTITADQAIVLNSGEATWARFENGAGTWSIDCRVSDAAGNAPVKISDLLLLAGGFVALVSAVMG